MIFTVVHKNLLIAIISGEYSNQDLKNFANLCYSLASPLIHKKISLGKINLDILGMKQNEIVFDCIADIFSRDERGRFYKVQSYFESLDFKIENLSTEEAIVHFRKFLFNVVNNNLIRLYSEVDSTLGKILRNMKIALKRESLFTQITRFGDTYLIPINSDLLWEKPPITFDYLQNMFSKTVLIHDNIPEMLKKLFDILIEQDEFQRAVPLVLAALLFKEVYILGWKEEMPSSAVNTISLELENEDVKAAANKICTGIRNEMYRAYVEKHKVDEPLFFKYMNALNLILINSFSTIEFAGDSYFEFLQMEIPDLTKDVYIKKHKKIIEYLAKIAKNKMKNELQKL